mmetsp:Transcript_21325/g.44893  ORF Transcript_21325/g.44893 Transcript_21325/m.44893 type:complete len:100 (-) Transcript_21325:12-311(-)
MNTTISSTVITSDAPSETSTEGFVAITAVIFINAVSVAISLLMVTAIGLPLLSEPKKRTRCASFNLYLLFLSTGDVIISTGGVYMWQSFYGIEWKGTED